MKKKDAKQLLGFIRKWDAKNIASEVRSKLLSNMINLKKVETEIEEAIKAAQEGLTEEEKRYVRSIRRTMSMCLLRTK